MTPELAAKILAWQTLCDTLEGQVKATPDLTDLDWLLRWYGETHPQLILLNNEKAKAKTDYMRKCAADMKNGVIPSEVWAVIKGSSTLFNQYLAGINPELFEILEQLENLSKTMETILSDMRTMLVSIREADRRDGMSSRDQGQDERKQQSRDAYFPNQER